MKILILLLLVFEANFQTIHHPSPLAINADEDIWIYYLQQRILE